MERTEVFDIVKEIFIDVMDNDDIVVEEITTADSVDEWTSLSNMLFIGRLEDRFNLRFKLKQLNYMRSIGDFVTAILENQK